MERVMFSNLKVPETTKYLIKPTDFNWKSGFCEIYPSIKSIVAVKDQQKEKKRKNNEQTLQSKEQKVTSNEQKVRSNEH